MFRKNVLKICAAIVAVLAVLFVLSACGGEPADPGKTEREVHSGAPISKQTEPDDGPGGDPEVTYTVTWANYDGSTLGTDTVEAGTVPSYGGTPERPADARYTYTFAGWSPEVSAVTGDVTYTAQFSETVNRYTVTWKNYDGSTLGTAEFDYGATPSYAETPVIPADAQYTYAFAGWSPSLSAVTGDAVYTAQFRSTAIRYSITYVLNQGTNSEFNPETYTAEDDFTLSAPTRDGFAFIGWSEGDRIERGSTGDKTFTANWEAGTEGLVYELNSGSYTVTGYTGSAVDVEIPETHLGVAVTGIGNEAFLRKKLTSVSIPASVTDIGSGAFQLCTELTSVAFAENSKLTSIGDDAFSDCYLLTGITIPEGVTTVGDQAFRLCANLADVTFAGKSKCESIGENAFAQCYELTRFVIPSGVTSVSNWMFGDCYGLTDVTIPNGLKSIGYYAFGGCQSLTDISIPSSVTSVGEHAFSGCIGLTDVVLPSSVTSLGDFVFYHCDHLKNVTIPSSVASVEKFVFDSCTALESVTIPVWGIGALPKENLKTVVLNAGTAIEANAFSDFKNLISVTIPDSVTEIGRAAFSGCEKLSEVRITDAVKWCKIKFASADANPLYYAGNLYLNDVLMDGLMILQSDLTSIGAYAFYNCRCFESVYLFDTVTVIGNSAFYGCSNLTSFTVPATMKIIGNKSFYGCDNLVTVTLPATLMAIGEEAFLGCEHLVEVCNRSKLSIVAGEEDYGYVGYYAKRVITDPEETLLTNADGFVFYEEETQSYLMGYTGAESALTLPALSPKGKSYSIYPDTFRGREDLTSLTVPSGLTGVEEGAFAYCPNLTSVTISEGVKSIGKNAFCGCANLTNVTIPSTVESIGTDAFDDCPRIQNVTMPVCAVKAIPKENLRFVVINGGTAIDDRTFADYFHLTSVTIGESVKSISEFAFYPCHHLIEVCNLSELSVSAGDWHNGYVARYAKHVITDPADSFLTVSDGYVFYEDENGSYLMGYMGTDTELSLPETSPSGKSYAIYSYAFYNCSDLTGVTIPEGVTEIGDYAFHGCSDLSYVKLPSGLKSVGAMAFYYCTGLREITIPEGVTTVDRMSFGDCHLLKRVTIPSSLTETGERAFNNCWNLSEVYITDLAKWCEIRFADNYANPLYSAGTLYLNGESVTELIIPDGVTVIGDYAFDGCTFLTGVKLPESVTRIGVDAFGGCSFAETDHGVSYIGKWAVGCDTSVNEIVWRDGTKGIGGGAFRECGNLKSVTVPDSVTGIGNFAFESCGNLTSVTFGENSKLTFIGEYAFVGCGQLTGITIPSGVTEIGNGAFESCGSLTEIAIPDGVTRIGDFAFFGCDHLKSVAIGENSKLTSIGDYAFAGCSHLTDVTVPESVTSIGEYAFEGCYLLKTP